MGLEPSCLLTLRDETLAMGFGAKAETVAAQAWLFEEFIAREARAGRFTLKFKPAPAPLLVHGHCHQKAFGAIAPVLEVLRLIPGAAPELIESSCCGMAGSFGYEAAHHEVSMQMAEAALLPAVRARPEAIVVAAFVSDNGTFATVAAMGMGSRCVAYKPNCGSCRRATAAFDCHAEVLALVVPSSHSSLRRKQSLGTRCTA